MGTVPYRGEARPVLTTLDIRTRESPRSHVAPATENETYESVEHVRGR